MTTRVPITCRRPHAGCLSRLGREGMESLEPLIGACFHQGLETRVRHAPRGWVAESLDALPIAPSGSKIELGESPQAALEREIREELTCCIEVGDEIASTSHEYEFGTVYLTTYYCQLIAGTPRLVEHAQMSWRSPDELRELDWAPADIPAVHLIQSRLGSDPTPDG